MELHSIEIVVKALNDAGVDYIIVGGRPQDQIDIKELQRTP